MGLLQLGLGGGALDCFSHVRQAPAQEYLNQEEEEEKVKKENEGGSPGGYSAKYKDQPCGL